MWSESICQRDLVSMWSLTRKVSKRFVALSGSASVEMQDARAGAMKMRSNRLISVVKKCCSSRLLVRPMDCTAATALLSGHSASGHFG
jgi:hypothetical protein